MKLLRESQSQDRMLDEAEWAYLVALEASRLADEKMAIAVAKYAKAGITLRPVQGGFVRDYPSDKQDPSDKGDR